MGRAAHGTFTRKLFFNKKNVKKIVKKSIHQTNTYVIDSVSVYTYILNLHILFK